jgi:hypothetical protein
MTIGLRGRLDLNSLAELLECAKHMRSRDSVITGSDWAWRRSEVDASILDFYWKSGNPQYTGRMIQVRIDAGNDVVSFTWNTGTGERSTLFADNIFVHVPADEVVA